MNFAHREELIIRNFWDTNQPAGRQGTQRKHEGHNELFVFFVTFVLLTPFICQRNKKYSFIP